MKEERERPVQRPFSKTRQPSGGLRHLQDHADWFFFLMLVLVLTITYSPVAFRPPYLPDVGEISEHDVKADRDLLIEDHRSTESRREEAAHAVPPVYDWDTTWGEALSSQLRDAFSWLDLSRASLTSPSEEAFLALRAPFAQRMEEESFPEDAFKGLLEMNNYQPLVERIQGWLTAYDRHRVVSGSDTLRDLSHASYTVRAIAENAEFRDSGNAGLVTPEEMRRQLFRAAVTNLQDLPPGLRKWLLDWVRNQIRPNFVHNLSETKLRRARATEGVDPVYFRIRQGEMVVREGEAVTNTMRLKLENLSRGQWTGSAMFRIIGLAFMLAMFLALSRHFLLQTSSNFPRDKKTLYILGTIVLVVSMLCTITLVLGNGLAELFNLPLDMVQLLPPVAMGSSMVSLIIGSRVALPGGAMLVGTLLSFLAALAANGGLSLFFYYLVGSLVGGFSLRTCRRRFDVLKAGGFIGMFQLLSMPLMEAISGSQPSWTWLLGMAAAVTSGFLVGLFSLATIPLLEMIFDVTTDSRLLELASGDHPLLKQLSLRAPGTYHHSVMMGNLAEAAAESIGANPLLARVMALYHDIGKIQMPQYFVENQSGLNRHDTISPSMSVKVIMSHIKHGVELVREYKLGGPILEAVTEHQGTGLLQFFYNKAVVEAAKRGVTLDEAEYRYPGPKPRSRESGILMVADSVEAAARTLKNPAPAQIQALVKRIVATKIADGQLDECRLTLREIARIEEAFCRVLILGFYHRRIEYPDQAKRAKEASRNVAPAPHPSPVPQVARS